MRRHIALLPLLAFFAGAYGCATPKPQDLPKIAEGKKQARDILEEFGEAVRLKEPDRVKPLLPPGPNPSNVAGLLELSTWMLLYKGYQVDIPATLAEVPWQSWRDGRVMTSLIGSNLLGDRLTDSIELVRLRDKWYLGGFSLARPQRGDALDLPEEMMAPLRDRALEILKEIRAGNAGNVHYMLPEEARYRWPTLSYWQRATLEGKPRRIPLFEDLRVVEELYIRRWPSEDDPLQVAWLAPGRVVVVFDKIAYDWPENGIAADTLSIEMTFQQEGDDWQIYALRLFGQAIPFSTE